MLVPDRHDTSITNGYRYGFNGKEKDDELKGEGNSINYEARMQDTRVGRFLSLDPLSKKFPWYSPYQFAGNTPIQAIDLDGAEEYHYTRTWVNGKPILKYSHKTDIYEYQWNPHKDTDSMVNFYLWEQVKNPRKEYVVHEEREGTWEEFDKVTFVTYDESWTYSSHDNMVKNKDGDYGGERYMHYALKGLQAVSEEQRMQGGGGSSVLGGKTIVKSGFGSLKKAMPLLKKTCFVKGTLVSTEEGLKKIEDIKVGDKVWSFNEKSKKIELKQVVNLSLNSSDELIEIFAGKDKIVCTVEHPFLIENKWVEAKDIKVGDKVTLKSGLFELTTEIHKLNLTADVYNFEVKDNHNYYVSASEILVHNNCDFPMKPSRYGNKLNLAYFNVEKIKKLSNNDLKEVVGKFRTSIKSRQDEAADYLSNGKATPEGTKGHNLRIEMEQEYLQKLENEISRRSKK